MYLVKLDSKTWLNPLHVMKVVEGNETIWVTLINGEKLMLERHRGNIIFDDAKNLVAALNEGLKSDEVDHD